MEYMNSSRFFVRGREDWSFNNQGTLDAFNQSIINNISIPTFIYADRKKTELQVLQAINDNPDWIKNNNGTGVIQMDS